MATQLYYNTLPISTRVDPRGRYYGKIESVPLSPEETVRGIMAFKKINAYSESTVLQLLNDLLQGAVELTALDGKTRTIGQMLRVYMSLEGSFDSPILTYDDKQALKVRVQLLKDMKYPVDGENFTLSPRDITIPAISNVHYSGQTDTLDAIKVGVETIVTGKNLNLVNGTTVTMFVRNPATDTGQTMPVGGGYTPSYNALVAPAFQTTPQAFTGDGPWPAELLIATDDDTVLARKAITLLPPDGE